MTHFADYPYCLPRKVERAFLIELRGALDIALLRATELQHLSEEYRRGSSVAGTRLATPRYIDSITAETRFLAAVEAFVSAWTRASLILVPVKKGRHQKRGLHLRRAVGLHERDILVLDNGRRSLRNAWMHLDEILGDWAGERRGDVQPSVFADGDQGYALQAVRGAVRIIDAARLIVAIPPRGVWSLQHHFAQSRDLHLWTRMALDDTALRWICVEGVWGIPVYWGNGERWMMRALDLEHPFEVIAATRLEMLEAFAQAARRRSC